MPSVAERMLDTLLSRPTVYRKEDVIDQGDKLWFPIHLGGKNFLLPLVNVASAEDPVAIAWFDPNPDKSFFLSQAAGRSMAELLRKMDPHIVVTPPSSKSGSFIENATSSLKKDIPVITLLGGDNKAEVQAQSVEQVLEYYPVTRLASRMPKYLGVSAKMRQEIGHRAPNGFNMVIADDVETTGNTIRAIEQLLKIEHHQIAVIIKESELNEAYPPKLRQNTRARMHFPEMKGFNDKYLYPVEPKAAIPAAIPL